MKDTIYREDAIEAVRKKLQDWGSYAFEDYRRGLYEAQDILEELPSAEAVSREDYHNLLTASEDIDRALREYQAKEEQQSAEVEPSLKAIKRQIDEHWYLDQPSAEAVQGEWIEREDWNGDSYYDCSVCGESFVLFDGTPSMNLYHYCPNCGADMRKDKADGRVIE